MRRLFLFAGLVSAAALPASAANVSLQANLLSSCTLALGTTGNLAMSTTGLQIGSENAGGVAATMTLIAVGGLPDIHFAAPTLTASPSGWSGSHTDSIRYTSLRGANQSYTSSATTVTAGGLTDTFTVHGKVDASAGFAAGNYTLTTVVTCS